MDNSSVTQSVHKDTLDMLDLSVEKSGVTDDVFYQNKSVEDYHKLVWSVSDFDDILVVFFCFFVLFCFYFYFLSLFFF